MCFRTVSGGRSDLMVSLRMNLATPIPLEPQLLVAPPALVELYRCHTPTVAVRTRLTSPASLTRCRHSEDRSGDKLRRPWKDAGTARCPK